jgi:hypothetical protein
MSAQGRCIAFSAVGLGLAGLLGSAAAGAALIDPLSQTRTISASVSIPVEGLTDSDSDSAGDFGTFDSSVAAQLDHSGGSISTSARQRSGIGPDSVGGSGEGATNLLMYAPGSYGSAGSGFALTFRVLQPLEFALSTVVSVNSINPPLTGFSSVTLRGGPGNQVLASSFSADGIYVDTFTGVLPPGEYTLSAGSNVETFGADALSASYQFGFDVVLVPEPAAGLLLAGGLLALALRRRRIG